jgi:catechol 2,3-dioxygenase-like lactoylglutathione lyase family enzyme
VQQTFDRAAEDIGNSVHLEHVNVRVPDQRLATLFYVAGLGLTRDPSMMVGDGNMWVNVGRSQFHLPTGNAQVLRGHTGLVIAGRAALLERLVAVRERLAGTLFAFAEHNDHVEATCPWGNRMRCYEPDHARFGPISIGIPYVEFDVPVGTTQAIADFYSRIIEVPARFSREDRDGATARVQVGRDQYLVFRETDRPLPEFDNHHVAIYLANFSAPYRRLRERNLVSQEDNRYQYRFRDIVDLDSGRPLFTVEHEVRSLTHPMYLRPLINRNPLLTNRNYAPGYEELPWAAEPLAV